MLKRDIILPEKPEICLRSCFIISLFHSLGSWTLIPTERCGNRIMSLWMTDSYSDTISFQTLLLFHNFIINDDWVFKIMTTFLFFLFSASVISSSKYFGDYSHRFWKAQMTFKAFNPISCPHKIQLKWNIIYVFKKCWL